MRNFFLMLARCFSAVRREVFKRLAISLLVRPFYNENIIIVWEKYLFNNQDTQGYRRQDVVWGRVISVVSVEIC